MNKLAIFVFACLAVFSASAQVAAISGQVVDQNGTPLPHAQVRVCSVTSTGTPCTPTAPNGIFMDYGMTIPAPNPYTTDQYGNYTLYAPELPAPNLYTVQFSPANGITWSYVQDGPFLSLAGGTLSGPLNLGPYAVTAGGYGITGVTPPAGTCLGSDGFRFDMPVPCSGIAGGPTMGLSADGTTGADTSLTESFYADFHCTTAVLPQGFDVGTNYRCFQSGVYPAASGTRMGVARQLMFSGDSQYGITQFSIRGRMNFNPAQNTLESMGFTANTAGVLSTDDTKSIRVEFTPAGVVYDNQGTTTLLLPIAGASSGIPGQTDSGFGLGWVPPPPGIYDVTMMFPGDATVIVSMVMLGTPQNSYSFRLVGQSLPVCATPCGSLGQAAGIQNLEVNGTGVYDYVSNLGYSVGGPRTVSYDMPNRNGYYNGATLLRFPNASNVYAWVPPSYDRHGNNRWILTSHGYGEDAQVVQQEYLPVTTYLLQQGYTIVSIDNTLQNCYGNAQCATDIQTAIADVTAALSLAPAPYMMADSMGGFTLLNAVMQGAVKPKAGILFCGNTNLAWDYIFGGASTPITIAYNISNTNPYLVATYGYDPNLAANGELSNLVKVPWLLFSSPQDTVVLKVQNSDLFTAMINANGGSATEITTQGNHLDSSNFQPAVVMNFLNSH